MRDVRGSGWRKLKSPRIVETRLEYGLAERLCAASERTGESQSAILRRALNVELDRMEGNDAPPAA